MSVMHDVVRDAMRKRTEAIDAECWKLLGTGLDLAIAEEFGSAETGAPPGFTLTLRFWPVMPGEAPPKGTTQVFRVSMVPVGHA
jgi:hypothetical protein